MLQYVGPKKYNEAYFVRFNFTKLLGEADPIGAVTTVIDMVDDSTATNKLIDTIKQVTDGKSIYVWLKECTKDMIGHSYKITCRLSATDGSFYVIEGAVNIE